MTQKRGGHRIVPISILGLLAASALLAQTAISTDGIIESTAGGFRFPDGSLQTTASAPGALPDTGQQECWDAAGVITSCPGTGQDGELQKGAAFPAPRFIDNGNGTVTDNLTGLVWLEDTNCFGPRSWAQALVDANDLADPACGLSDGSLPTDWRLPNIRELLSLVDYGEFNPSLSDPNNYFDNFDFPSNRWSSTTLKANTTKVWILNPFNGFADTFIKTTSATFVWPVRDPQLP